VPVPIQIVIAPLCVLAAVVCCHALRVDNPARISWVRIWRSAALTLAARFLVVWLLSFTLASALCIGLIPEPARPFLGGVLAGSCAFLLSQLYVAVKVVRQSWYNHAVWGNVAGLLVRLSDNTILSASRFIAAEERLVADRLLYFQPGVLVAVDRLYEYCVGGMAIQMWSGSRATAAKNAHRTWLVRNPAIKIKYLMRFLEADGCTQALMMIARSPEVIFPTWPTAAGERRLTVDRRTAVVGPSLERRSQGGGRRRRDSCGLFMFGKVTARVGEASSAV
jgi:hypothetical protein